MSFVDTASEWYSAWVSAIIYIISYYIGARYNGTWLYLRSVVVGNWLIDYIIYAQPTTKVYVWLSLRWFVILKWMQWKLTIVNFGSGFLVLMCSHTPHFLVRSRTPRGFICGIRFGKLKLNIEQAAMRFPRKTLANRDQTHWGLNKMCTKRVWIRKSSTFVWVKANAGQVAVQTLPGASFSNMV